MKAPFEYAKPEIQERIKYLSPQATIVLCDFIAYCDANQLPCVISDAVSDLHEDMALNRISSTHREGRGWDASAQGWTSENMDDLKRIFGAKYRYLAALGEHGDPRLIVIHDAGTGLHMHFQVHKKFGLSLRTFNKFDDLNKLV